MNNLIPKLDNETTVTEFRKSLNINLIDFISILEYNVSDTTMNYWERGKSKPPIDFIKRIKSKKKELTNFSNHRFYDGIKKRRISPNSFQSIVRQRDALNWLFNELGWKSKDDYYQLTLKILNGYGLRELYLKYSSVYKLLDTLFLSESFLPWKFKRVSPNWWKSETNKLQYLKWFESELNITSSQGWYNIKAEQFHKNHGRSLLKFGTVVDFAKLLYPEYNFLPWKFDITSTKFRYENPENMRSYIDHIAEQKGLIFPDGYYELSTNDFGKNNNHIKKVYSGYINMMKTIYPDIKWKEWLFRFTPDNYWHYTANIKVYMKWLEKRLRIKEIIEWYDITTDVMMSNFGDGALHLGNEDYSRNVYDLVSILHPNFKWDETKFVGLSKLEKRLFKVVSNLFPDNKIHLNRFYKFLINPDTGKPMQLDIYIPDISLAIEHQGEQHYKTIKYFHSQNTNTLQTIKKRDITKKRICDKLGIRLLYTDFKWDGRYEPIINLLENHSIYPATAKKYFNQNWR